MFDDLKVAIRSLRSSKTFTAAALVVLALGIGAGTTIFSVVDAVVLRPLPFDDPDRLVAVGQRTTATGPGQNPVRDPLSLARFAPQNYVDLAARQRVFDAIAAVAGGTFTMTLPDGQPEELVALQVTSGFFDVLRVYPAIGRTFAAEHEIDGQHRVAVLSDAFWRRRLNGNPQVVGTTIPLDAGEYLIAGIMPPQFTYPLGVTRSTDLWVPYVVPPDQRIRRPRTVMAYLQAIARLDDGVSMEEAQVQLTQIALGLQQEHPEWNADTQIAARPLRDHIIGGRTKSWMLLLLGSVGMLLLIACANVTNLLLARTSARHREVRLRVALGASRWRIVRGLMVESCVLAFTGTVFAVLLALWGIAILSTSIPASVPLIGPVALDARVLGAGVALAVFSGVLCGVLPALQLSRPDLAPALKEGTQGSGLSARRRRTGHALVITELALAAVLLVGTALFARSFQALMDVEPGFDPTNVLAVAVNPGPGRSEADGTRAIEEIVDRLRAMPGIVDAGAVGGGLPLAGGPNVTTMSVAGREPAADNRIAFRRVTPRYHSALGITLVNGRFFDAADRQGSAGVVILNEAAVARFFGGENPVGRPVTVDGERTVVGVIGNVLQGSLEVAPGPEAYVPAGQSPFSSGEIVVKTSRDAHEVLPAVKAAVFASLPDVPLRNIRTMDEAIAGRAAARRLNMLLLGVLGLLGLVVSSVGVYGVLTHVVSQRTREIGVRMALGATRRMVVNMVLVNASVLVAAGLVIGTAIAWYLGATVTTYLFRTEPGDPRAFIAALITLSAAALVASLIPALRAASVDPVIALRAE